MQIKRLLERGVGNFEISYMRVPSLLRLNMDVDVVTI